MLIGRILRNKLKEVNILRGVVGGMSECFFVGRKLKRENQVLGRKEVGGRDEMKSGSDQGRKTQKTRELKKGPGKN